MRILTGWDKYFTFKYAFLGLILATVTSLMGYKLAFNTSEDYGRYTWRKQAGSKPFIAIGLGITTRGVQGLGVSTVNKLTFLRVFLPSFCLTASNGYHYHFYIGFDENDPFFIHEHNREAFEKYTLEFCDSHCPNASTYAITLVLCHHTGSPAWAQNDAMFDAYLSGADYYYRINDDTRMVTTDWTETFIKVLSDYDPPNVGVVGPELWHPWEQFLTYDFTHRTHVDIFGLYYPRLFTEFHADTWINYVYKPGRVTMMKSVLVDHTRAMGRRYKVTNIFAKEQLHNQVRYQRRVLQR